MENRPQNAVGAPEQILGQVLRDRVIEVDDVHQRPPGVLALAKAKARQIQHVV